MIYDIYFRALSGRQPVAVALTLHIAIWSIANMKNYIWKVLSYLDKNANTTKSQHIFGAVNKLISNEESMVIIFWIVNSKDVKLSTASSLFDYLKENQYQLLLSKHSHFYMICFLQQMAGHLNPYVIFKASLYIFYWPNMLLAVVNI